MSPRAEDSPPQYPNKCRRNRSRWRRQCRQCNPRESHRWRLFTKRHSRSGQYSRSGPHTRLECGRCGRTSAISRVHTGNYSTSPIAIHPAMGWGQERWAGPPAGINPGSGWPLRVTAPSSAAGGSGTSHRARQENQGQERWTSPSLGTSSTTSRYYEPLFPTAQPVTPVT